MGMLCIVLISDIRHQTLTLHVCSYMLCWLPVMTQLWHHVFVIEIIHQLLTGWVAVCRVKSNTTWKKATLRSAQCLNSGVEVKPPRCHGVPLSALCLLMSAGTFLSTLFGPDQFPTMRFDSCWSRSVERQIFDLELTDVLKCATDVCPPRSSLSVWFVVLVQTCWWTQTSVFLCVLQQCLMWIKYSLKMVIVVFQDGHLYVGIWYFLLTVTLNWITSHLSPIFRVNRNDLPKKQMDRVCICISWNIILKSNFTNITVLCNN